MYRIAQIFERLFFHSFSPLFSCFGHYLYFCFTPIILTNIFLGNVSFFLFSSRFFPLFIWKFNFHGISVFSPNAGKYEPGKPPYLDTFHVVSLLQFGMDFCFNPTIWRNPELNINLLYVLPYFWYDMGICYMPHALRFI